MRLLEPRFTRVGGTDLFWLDGGDQTIAFQATNGAPIGDSASLSETWSAVPGGVYVFLGSVPTAPTFPADLVRYLERLGWPARPRLMWLEDPNLPPSSWSTRTLELARSGAVWSVARRADFRLVNYTLTVTGGDTFGLATEDEGWGFAATANMSQPVGTLFVPGGQYALDKGRLLLPLSGRQAGCWCFSITLVNGAESRSDFQRLGVGVRYFYPEGPYVRALDLATIRQPADGSIRLDGSLDVLRPDDAIRSRLAFSVVDQAAPVLASTFATSRGYGVTLTPLASTGSTPDAGLAFSKQPRFAGSESSSFDYYLSPQGAFTIGWDSQEAPATIDATDAPIYRLLCGTSGLEYLGMPADQTATLEFIPGKDAYATSRAGDETALDGTGTTSWIWASTDGPRPVRYYAQPESAPLFRAPGKETLAPELGDSFLDFLELPAMELAPSDGVRCFPSAGYRALSSDQIPTALALEASVFAPSRRKALLDADSTSSVASSAEIPSPVASTVGVTRQGMAVGVASDENEWVWVGIANDTQEVAPEPNLVFTRPSGQFRQALQTNRLFMVAANATEFMKYASVQYRLTAEGIARLRAKGTIAPNVLDAVAAAFVGAGYPTFNDEAAFIAALEAADPGSEQYLLDFEREAGLLTPKMGDWRFQMSPRNWFNPERQTGKNAIVVIKLALGRSLQDLTDDLPSWTWPEVAPLQGDDPTTAQTELQSIFRDARTAHAATADGASSPFANLVRILDDEDWTGIITFGCDMELSDLPEQLQALAAGIDAGRFFAHHLGFDVTPFGASSGTLEFGPTSLFGLLDYRDPVDQYFESDVLYAFKVLQLTVGFRNSAIVNFSSRVELLVNTLFGATAHLYPSDHGNNVILDGVYQRQQDLTGAERDSYVFSMQQQNSVGIEGSALRWVVLRSAQLVTARAADPKDGSSIITATFGMGGDLYFYEPKDFDPFSFGQTRAEEEGDIPATDSPSSLRFDNLGIRMDFTIGDLKPSFTFDTQTLSFDVANSLPRADSLFARFPLKLGRFVATDAIGGGDKDEAARGPESLGYISIGAPLQQSVMKDPWYGVAYDVDLGTLGALGGDSPLSLELLAAWSTGEDMDAPPMYLGVKLPGVDDAVGVELPLQGVMSLGFRSIQLLANERPTGGRQYMLRFRNFALRFLGISLPPGNNNILLTTDPNAGTATKLAWYAAYSSDDDPKKKTQPSLAARQVARRRVQPQRPPSTETAER